MVSTGAMYEPMEFYVEKYSTSSGFLLENIHLFNVHVFSFVKITRIVIIKLVQITFILLFFFSWRVIVEQLCLLF